MKMLFLDVDGFLVDTEELHYLAWRELVEKECGGEFSREEYYPMVGYPARENMAAICEMKGISGNFEELNPKRRSYFKVLRQRKLRPIAENVEFVKAVRSKFPKIRLAAVSSGPEGDVWENLEVCGLNKYVEFIVSVNSAEGLKQKPHPDLYFLALKKAGLPAEACLAFEDSVSGVIAAKAAGLSVVAMPNDLTRRLDFSGADLVIYPGETKNPEEILEKVATVR